ncbi:seryl-tRNA synthetase [Saccharothrix ecbatanensis]|jgi:seryl-tRNA synthetase|uniref:Seryl-tRNA synthetase n=1 Tax=Saccharothrix ecbatanensis TaxID=1105145 RepID=A0A7W9HJP7_9PSEU|nr:hypothetical protein [Saccharothrix ecbatanensis]MBB5803256.1 seryl-tRNA synthetase [Saccharothrix ecbatanensis]
MIETEVVLRSPVPAGRGAELERRIFFVSPQIASFRLVIEDGVVSAVRLFSAVAVDEAALSAKLNTLVEDDLGTGPQPPVKVVWTSAERVAAHDVYPALLAAGLVSESGEGQIAIGEPLISLAAGLDRRIRRLVVEEFGAVEYQYPTLVPTHVLDAAGYPGAFPQNLMFVTRLHEDLDVYRDFKRSYTESPAVDSATLELCRNVDYCLPPTMCYHTFGQYRDRVLPTGPVHVVTSRGKSFRHESRYATTLERLWDFTIRETVFIGGRTEVLDARERLMELVFALVDELGLDGYCEVASDPFFIGADSAAKEWSQRRLELKYELRLRLRPDGDVAVGSFNFHGDHFCRGFDIASAGGAPLFSGCAGFGLERLVYAVLCQHGTDPDGWPAAVRELWRGEHTDAPAPTR